MISTPFLEMSIKATENFGVVMKIKQKKKSEFSKLEL